MLKIIACDDDVAFLDNLHRMINRWSTAWTPPASCANPIPPYAWCF